MKRALYKFGIIINNHPENQSTAVVGSDLPPCL